MKNLANLMKQAQEMQSKMNQLQEKLKEAEVEGQAGGGAVKALLNGKSEVKKISIVDKNLLNPQEVEMLEDLIAAAINDARTKIDQLVQEKTKEAMSGIQLPEGMGLPI